MSRCDYEMNGSLKFTECLSKRFKKYSGLTPINGIYFYILHSISDNENKQIRLGGCMRQVEISKSQFMHR